MIRKKNVTDISYRSTDKEPIFSGRVTSQDQSRYTGNRTTVGAGGTGQKTKLDTHSVSQISKLESDMNMKMRASVFTPPAAPVD